jgi:hypothetical protein
MKSNKLYDKLYTYWANYKYSIHSKNTVALQSVYLSFFCYVSTLNRNKIMSYNLFLNISVRLETATYFI